MTARYTIRRQSWAIAGGFLLAFSWLGWAAVRFGSIFQGMGMEHSLPLINWFAVTCGPIAFPLFGILAAAAFIISDLMFRKRWIEWTMIAVFALLVIFAFTLSHIFLVLGAYSSYSPYSHVGAERELLQIIAYEPMIILTAVGMYMVTKSFFVSTIASSSVPIIIFLPGVFIGYLIVLTIKLRKSPFDLSTSHHAHQEIVKGVTTDFAGPNLGRIEIAHWYEYVFLLGVVYLFFAWNPLIAIAAIIIAYFLEILVDNTTSRVKWQMTLRSAWLVAGTLGVINLGVLYYLRMVVVP